MKSKKNQKPTEYDIHLQYRCPQCYSIHWLSFLETSTKNFKIVCDCGCIFKVKRTTGFKLKYESNSEKVVEEKPAVIIPNDLLKRAISSLLPYGFTKDECKELLIKSYTHHQTNDIGTLIKNTLEMLKNEHCTPI